MISVIVYGRNDSYGYNLAKRAAISLNCIAHVLDDVNDEIIFVDCNTPNDIPSFPESIADTLTSKTKQLLRVLRLRPEQYERGKNGTKFKVLEPLCRNIAIRRTNPANRWILNTNTDMVFTPLQEGISLSRIVSDLTDGFYELPRFEMPETLWETTNRLDPAHIIKSFSHWGLRLHLDEILTASEELLFDGPGDFQLALRSQLFEIGGMNEQMVSGWHVDSNLCKRMWLLNGRPKTILDRVYAFHCDHTRIQTVYHVAGNSTSNSMDDFFHNVKSPFIPEQADSWGMPAEHIEEIRLTQKHESRIPEALEKILPGMESPISNWVVGCNFLDTSLYYDDFHAFPYLADIVTNISPTATIAYVGNNPLLLKMLALYRSLLGHTGCVNYHMELLRQPTGRPIQELPNSCVPFLNNDTVLHADLFVIDFSMKNFPSRLIDGLDVPDRCPEVENFARMLAAEVTKLALLEKENHESGALLRQFVFVGCHNTSFDILVRSLFSCALTPPSTCIRSGVLSPEAFTKETAVMPFHYYVIGSTQQDQAKWISSQIGTLVRTDELKAADNLFNVFVMDQDRQRALAAFNALMNSDIGRGKLLLQIKIAEINGMQSQADALRNFINQYEAKLVQ